MTNCFTSTEKYETIQGVTRVEVIDDKGRSYTKRLKESETVSYSLQDDGKTLKIFIDN